MLNHPKVSIILLNWNGWRDTIECLESLFQIDYPNFQVIVVDNGSTDGSVEKIKEWAEGKIAVESKYFKFNSLNKPISSDRLVIIPLKENLGFARGNNVGIRYALERFNPEYILVLNNDTVVEPDFLAHLVTCLEEHPSGALSAPQVVDYYHKVFWQKPIPRRLNLLTYIFFATQLYHFFIRFIRLDMNSPSKIYVAPGCCLLLKTKVFKEIGFFDESTFLGWEEFIIAEKLFQKGLEAYFVPKSKIYHKIGRDTNKISPIKKMKIFLDSESYYQKKVLRFNWLKRVIIKIVRYLIYGAMLLKGGIKK